MACRATKEEKTRIQCGGMNIQKERKVGGAESESNSDIMDGGKTDIMDEGKTDIMDERKYIGRGFGTVFDTDLSVDRNIDISKKDSALTRRAPNKSNK